MRPAYPTIYEINSWAWLAAISARLRAPVDLASVPASEWDAIAARGFDAVWLMGVWERSPAGTAIAAANPDLIAEFVRALPDFHAADNVGSAYCIRDYTVAAQLGGAAALARARQELGKRGLRLILDFVPNHVAPDHPWTATYPDYFIAGSAADAAADPAGYLTIAGRALARGRDPNYPPWPDVVQLNAFSPALRQAAAATLVDIAMQCDGVRCDMAMLMLRDVFERTWGARAGAAPATEYWPDVIAQVRAAHPDFLFIAEAYWDREWDLQQQGFDFCYDKRFYDRLAHGDARSVRAHLTAGIDYQSRLLRFIENHDEPRAADAFAPGKARVAAVAIATLPGARLFYDGQFEGRRVRLPVFLGRAPDEAVDMAVYQFYTALLAAIDRPVFHEGEWQLCLGHGWADNASGENLIAWVWRDRVERYLIVVNLSGERAQARIVLPWDDLPGQSWRLADELAGAAFDRDGNDMADAGLYVDLPAWGHHFLRVQPLAVA